MLGGLFNFAGFGSDILGQAISGGLNFGFGRASAEAYKDDVRHLRRREYQDMVYSMKKAGLNPMLATGATPGHSAMQMITPDLGNSMLPGLQSATAANRQAKVAEDINPSKINLNLTERELKDLMRFQTYEQTQRIISENQKVIQETNLLREQSGTAAMQRALLQAQAAKAGWDAKQLEKIYRDSIGVNIYQDPLGYISGGIDKLQSAKKHVATGVEKAAADAKAKALELMESAAASARELRRWNEEQDRRARKYQEKYRGR